MVFCHVCQWSDCLWWPGFGRGTQRTDCIEQKGQASVFRGVHHINLFVLLILLRGSAVAADRPQV